MMSAPSNRKVLEARAVSDLHSVLHSDRKFRVHMLHCVKKFCTLLSILIYIGYFILTVNFLVYFFISFKQTLFLLLFQIFNEHQHSNIIIQHIYKRF